MGSALELFLDELAAEGGVALKTLEAYRTDIIQFLRFSDILPENISAQNISDFIQDLGRRQFAVKTVQRKISAVRHFCKFLTEEKILKVNPLIDITMPKREKPIPKFLTPDQITMLYQKALTHKNNAFRRVGTIILLCFASGLRVSEVLSIPLSALNHSKKQICVKGKGSKERIVFFDDQTSEVLAAYMQAVRPSFELKTKPSPFLFPSVKAKDGHFTRDGFFKDLKKLAVESGLFAKNVSPHTLRHSFATNLINHNVDLRSVQKMLGHENISTTEIYTHITNQKIIDSVFKLHPLSDKGNKE